MKVFGLSRLYSLGSPWVWTIKTTPLVRNPTTCPSFHALMLQTVSYIDFF